MEKIFLTLLNMSINATYIALSVIILRLLIKRAPRWIHCFLWAFVGIRLVFPSMFQSPLSLIPSSKAIPVSIVETVEPQINTGITYFNQYVNPIISSELAPVESVEHTPIWTITHTVSLVWIVGVVALLIYAIISFWRLKHQVRACIKIDVNVYLCDEIATPFILGIFRPRIYVPSLMNDDERESVLLHERAHIRRLDHIWKPLAYLLLAVYWYNPVLWIAYLLLCRDIELACDESVIKKLSAEEKKQYSTVLLQASTQRRLISACPLAFGEVGVKSRIKSILNYRRPSFWIIILSIIVCIAVSVFLLTDPKKTESADNSFGGIEDIVYFSELDDTSCKLIEADIDSASPYFTVEVTTSGDKVLIFGDEFHVYRLFEGEWINCSRIDDSNWNLLGYFASNNNQMRHKYSLKSHDFSNEGRYKFVTNCLIDGESPDKDGNRAHYEVGFEFTVNEGVDLIEPEEIVYDFTEALTLTYKSSPDPMMPTIRLNRLNNTYMFTYSGFSSHIAVGNYALYYNRLELESFDGDEKYLFYRVDNGFAFDENNSSRIPHYSYKAGEAAQTPVPDGAVFEWEDSTNFMSTIYDDIWFDNDRDGVEEHYSISFGLTSGVFTFILNVSEGEYKTSSMFYTDCVDMHFVISDDLDLQIKAINDNGASYLLDVIFDGEKIFIPQIDNENPQSIQTILESYATVAEIHDDYIVVSEGEDGHIHTNSDSLEPETMFMFYTPTPNDFKVRDNVIIRHLGIFNTDTALPSAVPISIKVVNIAEDDQPNIVKVNYGYIEEVAHDNFYIIVSEGEDGYIHTNDWSLSNEKLFKFFTGDTDAEFSVGDKVKIVHTGEFTMDGIPCSTPLFIEVVSSFGTVKP